MGDKQLADKGSNSDASAYHLHNSDHSSMPLVNTILDGKNYWAWSISVMTTLEAKDKVGFVDGSIDPPTDFIEFKKWKMTDSMIKSWMVNSISKEISDMFFFRSSKALWDVLGKRYGVANSPQMYHLHRYTSSMTQGTDSITTYFNKINRCWDEFVRLTPNPTCTCGKCTCNLEKKVADLDESIKLMQFLMGLNPIYDVIRTQILHLTPLPSIDNVYAMVISEESHKQINLSYSNGGEASSAMMAKSFQSKNDGNKKKDTSKADKYYDHCKANGHTRDTCFKIHGLGHASNNVLKHIDQIHVIDPAGTPCAACHNAKQNRLPFSTSDSRAENKLELLHIDLWGPYRLPALNLAQYFLTIVDDHTRATWTFLLQNKTQVHYTLKTFLEYSQKQHNANVRIIRTDNGTEFVNQQSTSASCPSFFCIEGYKLHDLTLKKIFVSRDVHFYENDFPISILAEPETTSTHDGPLIMPIQITKEDEMWPPDTSSEPIIPNEANDDSHMPTIVQPR
ncbi:Cysteine-rich RLK (RECEPTOR-like protein kinase) 8 [Senna tora]|uniref:Cysteine-rich RLK (RECEPTOR-like protein kinase) 8 n=1 Tax=Senna tora TaxID=362788 RepID=A0A834SPH2_9FABA|nr:Cysteine-rich RLK (RECEPTOR-like protein kinase) 8 [Senna tora]